MYEKAIFVFRRDLRLDDNVGLLNALENSLEVIPLFVFDPRQLQEHDYKSRPALAFMLKSLQELDADLRRLGSGLVVLIGNPHQALNAFTQKVGVEAVYLNRDYTPFSKARDTAITVELKSTGIDFHSHDDLLLVPPEDALKQDGSPYTVFTPFFRNASQFIQARPQRFSHSSKLATLYGDSLDSAINTLGLGSLDLPASAGRQAALSILDRIASFSNYAEERDIPAVSGTTLLSSHLKFGTVSVREAYHAIGGGLGYDHPLIRQLFWRDFYTHIAHHFPHVFGNSFKPQYSQLNWNDNLDAFQRWQSGTAGFPIVDAGMRELNSTGFMHNRVRMIVASFLVKDLHIDWRWGERYFAQHLTDYDPCVNNGNWQWSASTGCDAQPYFRIFNPWLQQKRFDPRCDYIKHWVPELGNLSAHEIHAPGRPASSRYPAPMLDHKTESALAKEVYRIAKNEFRLTQQQEK